MPGTDRPGIVPDVNTVPPWSYRAAVALTVPLVPHLLRSTGARTAHHGRLRAAERLTAWGERHRDPSRPLVWLHAASVGEGLSGAAVLGELKSRHPDIQTVFTHFSGSASEFGATIGADVHDFLPYDRRRDIDPLLAVLRPTLLLFSRLDIWPLLATRASAIGSRLALIGATVRPDSGRLRWPVASLIRPGYAALDLALAISNDDAARLARLGVTADRIVVTGDPRVDATIERIKSVPATGLTHHLGDPDTTMVAGSTWPEDELVLLEAFVRVRQRLPLARLVVVPHQPTAAHLTGLAALATRLDLPPPVSFQDTEAARAPLVVVDQVGHLALSYASGGIAYVGGGFGSNGIHSVIEPAAWQLPVVVGPHCRGAREVAMLRATGGLRQLPAGPAAVSELERCWEEWLRDPASRQGAGRAAVAALAADRGAAARTADRLDRWLSPR